MTTPFLTRFYHPESGYRVGLRLEDTLYDVTENIPTVGAFLRNSVHHVAEAIAGLVVVAQETGIAHDPAMFDAPPIAFQPHWLPPCDDQDVWAAGVTYERSRAARQEEARDGGDIYARVYAAERPELFFKSHGSRVVGPAGQVGIRADSRWNVPEPELALVINPVMELVGFTVGNDMSSRDIEGENPLYLPQAKVYSRSCALGPGILLAPSSDWPQTTIRLKIERDGQTAFEGDVQTARIKRRIPELLDYLGRSTEFPDGAILLTGTGVVPPNDFTLVAEDVVTITIDGVGTLRNPVVVV